MQLFPDFKKIIVFGIKFIVAEFTLAPTITPQKEGKCKNSIKKFGSVYLQMNE